MSPPGFGLGSESGSYFGPGRIETAWFGDGKKIDFRPEDQPGTGFRGSLGYNSGSTPELGNIPKTRGGSEFDGFVAEKDDYESTFFGSGSGEDQNEESSKFQFSFGDDNENDDDGAGSFSFF